MRLLFGVVVAVATWGCGGSYVYGPPPPAPLAEAPAAERCVAGKRLTLSSSTGSEHLLNDVTSDSITIRAREQSLSGGGYTFYRGQARLEVDEGLAELGDPLAASYVKDRDEHTSAKRLNAMSRPLFYGLIAAGTVVTLVGITQLKGENGVDTTGLVLVGAGLGATILSLPFLYFAKTSDEAAARYDLMKKLYLPSASDQEKLAAVLAAQRSRAENACGMTAPP